MRLQNADMGEDRPGDTQALPLLPPVTRFLHSKLLPSEVTQQGKHQTNKQTN